MAVTGLGLFAFVVVHMLGNLQIFLGPQNINDYGYFLQSKPELVWSARIGLIIIVILHVWAAISLSAATTVNRTGSSRMLSISLTDTVARPWARLKITDTLG